MTELLQRIDVIDSVSLGGRLSIARKREGLSRDKLGGIVGVSGQTVYRWERGEMTPSAVHLGLAAEALRCPVAWLLDIREHGFTEPKIPGGETILRKKSAK